MPGRVIANAFASHSLRKSVSSLAIPLNTLWPANISNAAPSSSSDSPSPPATFSAPSSSNVVKKSAYADLKYSLSISGNPSRVWNNYLTLLDSIGFQQLPLELHQEVLRKCTPSHQKLRLAVTRRLLAGNIPKSPHINEGRFQTIIRNIRAGGNVPTLDDYHFVLYQFAATGHYIGTLNVYRELMHLGHIPTAKTLGLCFQAIAHRFTLPITDADRPTIVEQTRQMYSEMLADMRRFDIPLTSVNADLSLRILKENLDLEALESLLRWAYGIDLSYPDKVPLEMMESKSPPLPFSTSALNTTLEILGQHGHISKMVQAFEVLTQPLPHAQEHFFSTFDEDEDDIGAISNIKPPFKTPHATPNTTTYTILMRHICRADHATFARHYINETRHLDREVNTKLRKALHYKPQNLKLSEIPSPNFSFNRGIVLPVLGQTNRRKRFGLMKWLSTKMPKIIKKKKQDLEWYTMKRDSIRAYMESLPRVQPAEAMEPADAVAEVSSDSSPSKLSPKPQAEPLDLDTDSTAPPPAPRVKPINLDVHIEILRNDIQGLEHFAEYLDDLVGRTSQRVKERLGRRVWAGKDVWFAETRKRAVISREEWMDAVGFRPRRRVHSVLAGSNPRPRAVGTGGLRSATWANENYFSHNRAALWGQRSFSTSFAGVKAQRSGSLSS
ncbi:hypothetical protein CC1G_00107 [Coprinopsis cinerea okayama7|uniref:Uncharacterized protein n=1 Tax=Coprinopsis cinerea (strain Okayama-7 / 130 / ATCC MYA-4618 / FGSC 9003) TaxID=240176 RepID=A8NWS1_COPC7|nr:hypothetical protein CC1G_00107 [Coprinopsis cinerea okayama7\|eukprot:XP_001836971.2 hypothetical protein CC1G_00107 [Coprinopsis cinerea okayama7\